MFRPWEKNDGLSGKQTNRKLEWWQDAKTRQKDAVPALVGACDSKYLPTTPTSNVIYFWSKIDRAILTLGGIYVQECMCWSFYYGILFYMRKQS